MLFHISLGFLGDKGSLTSYEFFIGVLLNSVISLSNLLEFEILKSSKSFSLIIFFYDKSLFSYSPDFGFSIISSFLSLMGDILITLSGFSSLCCSEILVIGFDPFNIY